MKLVIVESPSKAKTINKYLGSDFKVVASLGHIMDIPSKENSVLPEEDFLIKYEINLRAKKHIEQICSLAAKSNFIYLATDPDREGEAIASHIVEVIKAEKALKSNAQVKRIVFNEITPAAIKEALKHPRDLDQNLINAQQARRALDYLVGFNLSPLLWRKLPGCKSAGRVQSVALRFICEREQERNNFKKQEYWNILLDLITPLKDQFTAKLSAINQKKLEKLDIKNKQQAQQIVDKLKNSQFQVKNIEQKQQKRNPNAPFITSTLQQEAARKLGFSAKKTMQIAQKLYEGIEINSQTIGLITYMRTDGVNLAEEAIGDMRQYIKDHFGSEYLPNKKRIYKTKVKNAQEAHEAIRPTNINMEPASIKKYLETDSFRLYELIWKRALACQMENAILGLMLVEMTDNKEFELKANGSTIIFDGFYKLYKESTDEDKKDEEKILPPLKVGDALQTKDIRPTQHFTEPPPRYSEASLVKNLEEAGIGRPSTYATIISVLQERKYVELDKKRFIPHPRGIVVTEFLKNYFSEYVEYDFTADLEDKLDTIASGELDWKKLLRKFWEGFSSNIDEVKTYKISEIIDKLDKILEPTLFPESAEDPEPRKCKKCSLGRLGLRFSKFGAFIACSNYPQCDYTKNIIGAELELNDEATASSSNNKLLGLFDNKNLYLKKGPYGWYIQLGDKKEELKRIAVPKLYNPQNIDENIARKIASLPLSLGKIEGQEVILNIGKYGPYLKVGTANIQIPAGTDPFLLTLNEAKAIYENSKKNTKKIASKKSSTKKS